MCSSSWMSSHIALYLDKEWPKSQLWVCLKVKLIIKLQTSKDCYYLRLEGTWPGQESATSSTSDINELLLSAHLRWEHRKRHKGVMGYSHNWLFKSSGGIKVEARRSAHQPYVCAHHYTTSDGTLKVRLQGFPPSLNDRGMRCIWEEKNQLKLFSQWDMSYFPLSSHLILSIRLPRRLAGYYFGF